MSENQAGGSPEETNPTFDGSRSTDNELIEESLQHEIDTLRQAGVPEAEIEEIVDKYRIGDEKSTE